jgi:hypothetical protein
MTKKGPLGKAEKFYIEQKYADLGLEQICKELDRAKGLVEKHAKTKKLTEEEPTIKPKSRLAEQFAQSRGATVMTENASQMGDEFKRGAISTEKTRKCTVTIRRLNNE